MPRAASAPLLALWLVHPAAAAAQDPPEQPPPEAEAQPEPQADPEAPPPSEWDLRQGREPQAPEEEERSLLGQLAQTLFALLVVVGIIYFIGKVAMARLGRVGFAGRSGARIQILERVQLDPRHAVYLIQVDGGPPLLIGTGEGRVQLISSLDTTPDNRETGSDFRRVLDRTRTAPEGGQPQALSETGTPDAPDSR